MEVLYVALSFDDFLFAGMFPCTGEVDMRGLFPLVEGETLPPDLALGLRAVATQRENTASFLKQCSFAISLRFGGLGRPWPDSRSSSRRPLPTFAAHSKLVCCRQDRRCGHSFGWFTLHFSWTIDIMDESVERCSITSVLLLPRECSPNLARHTQQMRSQLLDLVKDRANAVTWQTRLS